jgi:hypothetical protein
MPALLSGQLLNAWTLFESLAADLWEVALNEGSKDWAKRAIQKQGQLQPEGAKQSSEQGKSIKLERLIEYSASGQMPMGTMLKAEKKVDFLSLKNITSAYAGTWGNQITSMLNSQDFTERLVALECVRNLIAHRGRNI